MLCEGIEHQLQPRRPVTYEARKEEPLNSHHDIFEESLGLSSLLALHVIQILGEGLAIILLPFEESNGRDE